MPYLTVTEKSKASTKPRFSHLLQDPARKHSGFILGHTHMLNCLLDGHTRGKHEVITKQVTVTRNDLCAHQSVRLVNLTIGAARHPLDRLAACGRRRRRHSLGAVAVGTHGEAALAARPVNVEQRSIACIAHLAYTLDCPLPHYF